MCCYSHLVAADLEGVFPGRDLAGPDGAHPDDSAEHTRIRARQDPVLDRNLFKQPELVKCLVRLQIL